MNAALRILKSTRLWGLLGTGLAMYFIVFVVLGKVDIGWMLPDTKAIARTLINTWPRMPFFVQKEQTDKGEVVYYTVPTHQMTQQELRNMGMTNAVVQPPPTTPSAR